MTGHVVLAPDKFKGSLTAPEVASHLASGLRQVIPGLDIRQVPVADGGDGDGTIEMTVAAGFRRVGVRAAGPTGQPVDTAYGERDGVAVVELADVSGLRRLPHGRFEPLRASSYGTGQVIRAALDAGCRTVVLGLGGSASTDGGAGLVQALGARLFDRRGEELPPGGAALPFWDASISSGCTRAFMKPKSSSPTTWTTRCWDRTVPRRSTARRRARRPSRSRCSTSPWRAGRTSCTATCTSTRPTGRVRGRRGEWASPRLPFSARPYAPASRTSSTSSAFGTILPALVLSSPAKDRSTSRPCTGRRRRASRRLPVRRVPVVAVAGQTRLSREDLAAAGIAGVYALTDIESDAERCIAEAGPLLERLAAHVAADHLADWRAQLKEPRHISSTKGDRRCGKSDHVPWRPEPRG